MVSVVIYTATGTVLGHPFWTKPLNVSATDFSVLKDAMAEASQTDSFCTEGVNSQGEDAFNPTGEPYCEDLIYPRIEWTIERRSFSPRLGNPQV